MEDSLLQRFLDNGMLAIGEGDEKFDYLRMAAQDISQTFRTQRPSVITHSLVALDPEIPNDEPVLVAAEGSVKTHWRTFRNLFPDRPTQLLRAVILEALQLAAMEDPVIASIIWLTGGSFLPYARLLREAGICQHFVRQMGTIAEEQVLLAWTGGTEFTLPAPPTFTRKTSGVEKPVLDKEKLQKHLHAASGPQTPQNTPSGPNPNQYWPNQNPTQWAAEFASRAAAGIADEVDTSVASLASQITKALDQSSVQISAFATTLNDSIRAAIAQTLLDVSTRDRRTNLLWWKETLYSAALCDSYRSLDAAGATALMAYDLHSTVPACHPQSIEFLLRETVREVMGAARIEEKLGLANWCHAIPSSRAASVLRPALGQISTTGGRLSLLQFVQQLLADGVPRSEDVASRVGVSGSTVIAADELAVWLFRDLQANRLAAQQ